MKIRTQSRTWATIRVVRLLSCCLAAVALWACGPVYIPVPPPGEISFTPEALTDAAGNPRTLWITSGGPNGNAINATFFVTDVERGAGVIARARADGSFVAGPMEGNIGDHVSVYFQELGGRDSVSACVLLSDLPAAAKCD